MFRVIGLAAVTDQEVGVGILEGLGVRMLLAGNDEGEVVLVRFLRDDGGIPVGRNSCTLGSTIGSTLGAAVFLGVGRIDDDAHVRREIRFKMSCRFVFARRDGDCLTIGDSIIGIYLEQVDALQRRLVPIRCHRRSVNRETGPGLHFRSGEMDLVRGDPHFTFLKPFSTGYESGSDQGGNQQIGNILFHINITVIRL